MRICNTASLEATTEARLEDWVFEIELQLRAVRNDLSLVLQQDLVQEVGRKNAFLKCVKHTHDTRHVDPLLVSLQRDSTGNRGFERLRVRSGRDVAQRQPKI